MTDQARSETQRMMELEEVLKAISKSQGMIEFAMDGVVLTANQNFLDALGYTLEEVKGRHHRMFVDDAYARGEGYRVFWEALNRGEFQAAEYKRIGKGGREVWIQATYNPILDLNGRPFKVIKIATDVTAQKIQYADFQGQVAAISKSQGTIEFSMDGVILNANENFLDALGYTLAEVKGKHHRIFVEEEYGKGEAYRAFWEALRQGEFQAAEYKRVGKGGREVWIQATYNPILDLSGRPFKVLKIATDITGQVQAKVRLQNGVDDILRVVSAAAGGDLTHEVSVVGEDAIGQVGGSLRKFFQDLREKISKIMLSTNSLAATSEELAQTSTQMSATSEETSVQANLVSAAAEQVNTNLQLMVVSTEELNASIREIASNTSMAAQVSQSAVKLAVSSNETVNKLGVSSAEISAVVKVINSIAQQTNLLALNAAIEAARAGDAGRGFAVVANEVKELARRTAQATDDIEKKIGMIQQDTRGAITTIQEIAKIINQVGDISGVIATAVGEQAATTSEIGRNVNDAATGAADIARNIAGVAMAAASTLSAANQSMIASSDVSKMSVMLQELIDVFKI